MDDDQSATAEGAGDKERNPAGGVVQLTPNNAEGGDDPSLSALEQNALGYEAGIREAHNFSTQLIQHTDRMLTWAIGLMGAGLVAIPKVLSDACPGRRDLWVRIGAIWATGVLLAVIGRLLAKEMLRTQFGILVNRSHGIRATLISGKSFKEKAEHILSVMSDEDSAIAPLVSRNKKLDRGIDVTYYGAHILLVLGLLALLYVSGFCQP